MRMPSLVTFAVIVILPVLSCGGSSEPPADGGGSPGTGRYVSNGDGTLTDSETGFLWQQTDDDVSRNWDDAIAYCQALTLGGLAGWGLPDIDELWEIVDTRFMPTIDPAFVGTNASSYWSSSTPSSSERIAWSVNFLDGRASNALWKTQEFYCRCVRK